MIKIFFATCKMFGQVMVSKPALDGITIIITAIVSFFFKTMEVDIFLFGFMYFFIIADTGFGVYLAKKKGTFDRKLLYSKFRDKTFGYISFLVILFVFLMMMYIASLREGTAPVSIYYYNIFMITTFLFIAGVEFISIKDKISEAFGVRTPVSITKHIEKFIDTENLTDLTNTNPN